MIVIETKAAIRNRQSNRPGSVWSVPSPDTGALGYEAAAPGNGGARVFNGRLRLRITDYAENHAAALRLLEYLRSVNPAVKVILTVSPVPFSDTFSGQDVIVANTYSKSVLRSVAQDLARELDWMDYFPSYEIAMLSDPALAWLPDHRHVQREHVGHIVSEFMSAYLDAAPAALSLPTPPAVPDPPEPAASVPADVPDLAASRDIESILASCLFDPAFYRQQLQEHGLDSGPDLVTHYVLAGEAAGLLPHRLFDPAYYRADTGGAYPPGPALAHYVREGWRLGLRTHPLFDGDYYSRRNFDVLTAGMNPLVHYLTQGGAQGCQPPPCSIQ